MSIPEAGPRERRMPIRTVLVVVAVQLLLVVATTLIRTRIGSEDTDAYRRYINKILSGEVPYRDFPVEYPPLALTLFLAPRLIAPDVTGFRVAFAVEMLLINAATVWLVAGWVARTQGPGRVRSRLAWYTVFFTLLSRLVVCRYDAAPMFVAFAASVLWFSGRAGFGGIAAAIGALLKIFPAAIAVVAAAWDLTRPGPARGRGLAGFALTILVGAALWLGLGGIRGVTGSLGYQLGRGFEYGSVYSGVQMLGAKVVGEEILVVRDHAAWSSITAWSTPLSRLVFPLQAAAVLMVGLVYVRRGMTEGVRYSGAAVLAFILMGKVFSPQYLIWLIPYISVLEEPIARRGCWLFAAGCTATLLAPGITGYFPRTSVWVILAYNVKNLIFVALLILLTFGPRAVREGE